MNGHGGTVSGLRGPAAVERYYRFHARIYDATRWSFLFGRTALVDLIASHAQPRRILEVGCGTGKNLLALAQRFPEASVTGVDLSGDMLARARKNVASAAQRVRLLQCRYDEPLHTEEPFDLVVFSYALSMFNPGWERAIALAKEDLGCGGHIAVVDFHQSRFGWFGRWMAVNHVRMQGQLLPELQRRFVAQSSVCSSAYGGVWEYFSFIGCKR